MDPSWTTMENHYHVNATANNNNNNSVDALYPTPESGNHHHHHHQHHHRQLPTFHKILNNSNSNSNSMHHGYHRKYPPTNDNDGGTTMTEEVKFWNPPDPTIRIRIQAKPEFGSRFSTMDSRFQNAMARNNPVAANDTATTGDCSLVDYYHQSSNHRQFRQRSSLNNVDQYYHHAEQQQRKNPTSRRHSSTTSSILDVPSIVHQDGARRFHRDSSSSPHRRGSSSIFAHHVQPQSQPLTMIEPDDSRMGVATVDGQHFSSKTGGSNNNNNNQNNNGNLARHSPLHQQQQQQCLGMAAAAVTSSSSSSSSSASSMIMAPFSTQAENRAFHHHHHQLQYNNHNHNHNLHHLQQQQQQLQFGGGLQPSTSSMYSSSTSSLQTTTTTSSSSATSQTGPAGTVSPRNGGFNGYCNGLLTDRRQSSSSSTILIDDAHQCSNTQVNNHTANDNFDADNDDDGDGGCGGCGGGGGGGKTSSSFHLRVNSPDVGEPDDDDDEQIVVQLNHNTSITNNTSNNLNTINKNQNHDDNHLHVPNHYINCDDDLLEEVDEDFQQNHRAVRRHRSLPAPTFSMSASSSWNSMKPPHPRSSSFRIRTTNRTQSATRIQEPNGYWRVQVKKSKPYLGIAIEGGSNVSAQSQPRIINIQEDGAANVEGLHVGHIIMEVDGKTTNFMNHGQVAQMIARAYYNTPEKDYVEFLVREKSRNEFDLRRSSFMLLNSSYE